MEMGNVSKRQQPDHRKDNSRRLFGLASVLLIKCDNSACLATTDVHTGKRTPNGSYCINSKVAIDDDDEDDNDVFICGRRETTFNSVSSFTSHKKTSTYVVGKNERITNIRMRDCTNSRKNQRPSFKVDSSQPRSPLPPKPLKSQTRTLEKSGSFPGIVAIIDRSLSPPPLPPKPLKKQTRTQENSGYSPVIVETMDGSLLPPPLPPKPLEKQTRIQANNGSSPENKLQYDQDTNDEAISDEPVIYEDPLWDDAQDIYDEAIYGDDAISGDQETYEDPDSTVEYVTEECEERNPSLEDNADDVYLICNELLVSDADKSQ